MQGAYVLNNIVAEHFVHSKLKQESKTSAEKEPKESHECHGSHTSGRPAEASLSSSLPAPNRRRALALAGLFCPPHWVSFVLLDPSSCRADADYRRRDCAFLSRRGMLFTAAAFFSPCDGLA